MSNLDILEEINKYKEYTFFDVDSKNRLNDEDLYICKIEKSDKNDLYVKLSKDGDQEIKKKEEDRVKKIFVPLLIKYLERHVLYCAGKSGDGKGVFVADMTRQYHILYPTNKIYYICSTPIADDISFGKYASFIKQIPITAFENMSESNILKSLKNSLVVMDDNDNITKEEKHILNSLQNTILFLGRKYRVSMFKISHFKTDYQQTRSIIPELDYYVTFVNRDLVNDRLLNEYKKIPKETYYDLKGSIWAFFNFKLDYVITNKKIFFLE